MLKKLAYGNSMETIIGKIVKEVLRYNSGS